MFSGSLRRNLDPLSECTNDEIEAVLEKVQLTLSGDMDAPLQSLSHGERNLIAVARVLLRKTKLMIEDEATASVDTAHDNALQVRF